MFNLIRNSNKRINKNDQIAKLVKIYYKSELKKLRFQYLI